MGLSRNKVAVSEGAAGSPPFYGEQAICREAILRMYLKKRTKDKTNDGDSEGIREEGLLFNFQRSRKRSLRNKSVLQTQRVHPFPFRTRKLSSAVVKILYGRLYGKIAQCRHGERADEKVCSLTAKLKCANYTLTTKAHSSAG